MNSTTMSTAGLLPGAIAEMLLVQGDVRFAPRSIRGPLAVRRSKAPLPWIY
jgi:hypothetical protein